MAWRRTHALVSALTVSQARIKETAEENSHALKTPLAVIAQSGGSRSSAPSAGTGRGATQHCIDRTGGAQAGCHGCLAQRDLEQAGADMIYPVRQPLDLSRFLGGILPAFEASLAVQGKRLVAAVDAGVMACANEDALEPVIENILENAASFTPAGKPVEVGLQVEGRTGVPAGARSRARCDARFPALISSNGASFRDPRENSELGLQDRPSGVGTLDRPAEYRSFWAAASEARNRAQGGFEIVVRLPVDA